jgi:hypothetical protein
MIRKVANKLRENKDLLGSLVALEMGKIKSAISIISCTSPSPSDLILPISNATKLPNKSLFSLSLLATLRIICPRSGAGIILQSTNAA